METTSTVGVSLPKPLIAALRRQAELEDRSKSRIVRRALERYIGALQPTAEAENPEREGSR